MKNFNLKYVTVLSAILLALSAAGQTPDALPPQGMQQRLQQMHEANARNEEQLHTYEWIETMTLTMDGRILPSRQSICRYAADGTVVKTPLGQQGPPNEGRGGMIRKHIVEKKKEELLGDVEEIHALLQMYVPLNQSKFSDALRSGKVSFDNTSSGGETIILPDFAKPGDQFRITLNRSPMQIDRILVKTYFDKPKDVMNAEAQFATLPDGTRYRSITKVEVPSKKLTLTIASANFSKGIN